MVIGQNHVQHVIRPIPVTAGGMDEVALRGGDALQDRHELVCDVVALSGSAFWVVDHVYCRGPSLALADLPGQPGPRQDDVKISRRQPLLHAAAVNLAVWKGGVQGQAHAVEDTVEADLRHGTPPAAGLPACAR